MTRKLNKERSFDKNKVKILLHLYCPAKELRLSGHQGTTMKQSIWRDSLFIAVEAHLRGSDWDHIEVLNE